MIVCLLLDRFELTVAVGGRAGLLGEPAALAPEPGRELFIGEVSHAAEVWRSYSSWPMPTRYTSISGTSMATPHVAGLAALLSQATGAAGQRILVHAAGAQPLDLPAADVGAGLAQAPL